MNQPGVHPAGRVVDLTAAGKCEKKSKSLICLRALTDTPSTRNAWTFVIRRGESSSIVHLLNSPHISRQRKELKSGIKGSALPIPL
jgi:hypothetical protein